MKDGKISVAMCFKNFEITGISTVLMNYCEYIDFNIFEITIFTGAPINELYQKKCESLGIKICGLPPKDVSLLAYYKSLYAAMREEAFDIFHVNGSSALLAADLLIASLCGIRVRIAHSHNTSCNHLCMHKFLLPMFNFLCTDRLACGEQAGRWLFGNHNFCTIRNGIITEKFIFNSGKRAKVRENLSLTDKFVIGHVGCFNNQKNQGYLFQVFDALASLKENAFLLLVGNGPDAKKISQLVSESQFKDRILLYGETDKPENLYMAMDIFCFPSKFEGLPVALLEAQMTGLPCIVSDRITKEIDFGDIKWGSISDEPAKWADEILHIPIATGRRSEYYFRHADEVNKYNIRDNAGCLEDFYKNAVLQLKTPPGR